MREFWTLFKYELKVQTPLLQKGGKKDILGGILAFLILTFLACIGVEFLLKILRNYFVVELNKVYAPIERATEMVNLLYLLVLAGLTCVFLERARKVFADDKNKVAFMRLPVNQRNIFLSKFAVITLHVYLSCVLFVLAINIVVSTILPVGTQFWLATIGVCAFMPLACVLFVTLFILPYIKVVELLSNRYVVLFILYSVVLAGAFVLYTMLLNAYQLLLTTGSIRFLFNERFISILQGLYKYSYPASVFVDVLLGQNSWVSWLVIVVVSLLSLVIMYFVSKKLYKMLLYKQPVYNKVIRKPKVVKQYNSFISLLKKECINVIREPRDIFSCLSVAMSMPIMAYCCFTLSETLIRNALGVSINFALALLIVLLFGVLTNTFCSTNISRDGQGILKMKTLPVKTDTLFLSKVVFCAVINCLSVILTCTLLICTTSLQVGDGLLCMLIGCVFTFAQTMVATRIDLNRATVSLSDVEKDKQSTKTLSKVILIGAVLSAIATAPVVISALFSSGIIVSGNTELLRIFMYIAPVVVSLLYLGCAVWYYRTNLSKSFERLAN